MYFASKLLPLPVVLLLVASVGAAENYRRLGTEFEAMRAIELEQAPVDEKATKPIVVAEFLHHGLVQMIKPGDPTTVNMAVVSKTGNVVPMRLLQLGPGDCCRIAFEPLPRQTHYEIYYGGAEPPSPALLPKWTNDAGLLFESREYQRCNLRRLDSVRDAFDSATPIGADYVSRVFHAHNPTDIQVRPFLSRYTGKLHIKEAGEYLFWTSSADASFLLIDGKVVASAPGQHRPMYRARRDRAGSIRLAAGAHDFAYYHAAIGNHAMMAVLWTRGPYDKKNRPAPLPPEWFHNGRIVRVQPGPVTTRRRRLVPDFEYKTLGDVPLPDNRAPLIGVGFKNRTVAALAMGASSKNFLWDFGDGQTSTETNPYHVFLKPGLYTVSLSVRRGGRNVVMTNRLRIERPYRNWKTKEKAHTIDDYIPTLTQYDPAKLDPSAAKQLALAYEFKSKKRTEDRGQKREDRGQRTEDRKEKRKEGEKSWLRQAVEVGRVNLKATTEQDDRGSYELARLAGSIARFDLGDPRLALAIYRLASRPQKISDRKLCAECAIRAADIALNELSDRKTALEMLRAVAADFGVKDLIDQIEKEDTSKKVAGPPALPSRSGMLAARFFRVLGDYAASRGKGPLAVAAYRAASAAVTGSQSAHTKETARRGAFSRSTEQFLKKRQLDRAAREIAAWCEQFPDAKIDGYFTLLYAQLLFDRGQFEQVLGQCEQLSTVNGVSPYLDRLLMLAAEAEERRGHPERAKALLRELIDSHPGSPLVPEAKGRLER